MHHLIDITGQSRLVTNPLKGGLHPGTVRRRKLSPPGQRRHQTRGNLGVTVVQATDLIRQELVTRTVRICLLYTSDAADVRKLTGLVAGRLHREPLFNNLGIILEAIVEFIQRLLAVRLEA